MDEIRDWSAEHGSSGDDGFDRNHKIQNPLSINGVRAIRGEAPAEALLEKSRFVTRIYVPDRPIQIFNAGFVEKRYIKFEEQNSRPDIRITVSPPNLALEAIDYLKEKGLEGTPLAEIVKHMQGPEKFGFMVTVDVPTGTGLPKNQWIKSKDGLPGFEAKNYIKFSFGEGGLTAESATLSHDEIQFSLGLLGDSIRFTLTSTEQDNPSLFSPKKPDDAVMSERFVKTMSEKSKDLYKYVLASIDEVLSK